MLIESVFIAYHYAYRLACTNSQTRPPVRLLLRRQTAQRRPAAARTATMPATLIWAGGEGLEVLLLGRPFVPALAVPALVVFALSNVLRWWVIATLGIHWNVQVINSISGSMALGVVTAGDLARLVQLRVEEGSR